jgi:C1A family cysteine protease
MSLILALNLDPLSVYQTMSKIKRHFSSLVEHLTGKIIKLGGLRRSTTTPPNTRKYRANIYEPYELPTKVDLRPFLTKVEDQSQTNSCVANALAGAYEYLAKRQLGDSGDVSRLFIYYNARALMGWEHKDDGSTITGAIETLEEFGTCSERNLAL